LSKFPVTRVLRNIQYRIQHQDGSWIYWNANMAYVADDASLAGRIQVIARDITKERQTKEVLLDLLRKYQNLVENSRDVIYQQDFETGDIIYISASVKELLGYPLDKMPGLKFDRFVEKVIHPDDQEAVKAYDIQTRERRKAGYRGMSECEYRAWHKNGALLWLNNRTFPLFDEKGQLIAIQGILRDITDRKLMEQALQESEEWYRGIVENTQAVFAITSPLGTITFAAGRWLEMTGYYPEEVRDHSLLNFLYPEDINEIKTRFYQLSTEPSKSLNFEFRLVHKDGSLRWENASAVSRADETGQVSRIFIVIHDVTEKKQLERLAAAHYEISRLAVTTHTVTEFLEHALDIIKKALQVDIIYIFLYDKETDCLDIKIKNGLCEPTLQIIDHQKVMAGELGIASETARSRKVIFIDDMSQDPRLHHVMDEIRKSGAKTLTSVPLIVENELLGVLQTITRRPREFDLVDVRQLTALCNELATVLQRKQLEQQLLESEQKFRDIIKNALVGIYRTTWDGKLLDANPTLLNILGYTSIEEINQVGVINIYSDPQKRKELLAALQAQGEVKNFEVELVKKDGSTAHICLSAKLIQDSKGNRYLQGTLEDVTERRLLERQLLQAQKMESIGTLAGGIAHDFNNLLGGIMGYCSLLLAEMPPDSPYYQDVNAILKTSKRASELTAQLLAFARGGKYNVKPINVNTIVREVCQLLSRTIDKAISIETILSQDLAWVMADAGQLQQAILNIAINARDAMPGGGHLEFRTQNITLDEKFVKAHLGASTGPAVLIAISDTGIGMDEETKSKIFDPFFTTKERKGGTGLGLAMVYGIVKNHGGYIEVRSEVGKGTTFEIYLPAIPAQQESSEISESIELAAGNETILIVDDEEVIRTVGQRILEKAGYKVLLASTGPEAIELYRKNQTEVALVILDMIMPEMGGREIYESLRHLNPEIKVLLSSGFSQEGQAQKLLEEGVQGFVQKPFQMNEFLQKIRLTLSEKS
ncbi:MAG: PAS domain S-box protein, partial [candidate division KSB1 bacterium]|nr:PAS domain S-box protein [candidate division KSB1 bacterium]